VPWWAATESAALVDGRANGLVGVGSSGVGARSRREQPTTVTAAASNTSRRTMNPPKSQNWPKRNRSQSNRPTLMRPLIEA